jgi:hypothetical protein
MLTLGSHDLRRKKVQALEKKLGRATLEVRRNRRITPELNGEP